MCRFVLLYFIAFGYHISPIWLVALSLFFKSAEFLFSFQSFPPAALAPCIKRLNKDVINFRPTLLWWQISLLQYPLSHFVGQLMPFCLDMLTCRVSSLSFYPLHAGLFSRKWFQVFPLLFCVTASLEDRGAGKAPVLESWPTWQLIKKKKDPWLEHPNHFWWEFNSLNPNNKD